MKRKKNNLLASQFDLFILQFYLTSHLDVHIETSVHKHVMKLNEINDID